jgi:plastocyanin
MSNSRSIKIVAVGNGAAFQPDPSGVQAGDKIHWDNQTTEAHLLVTSTGFQTNKIAPGEVSSRGLVIGNHPGQPVTYSCSLHPQEQGTITIVPAVVVPPAFVPAVPVPPSFLVTLSSTAAPESDISSAPKRKAKAPTRRARGSKKTGRGKKKPE